MSNPTLPPSAVWFVTGCSTGIGHALITSILSNPHHRIVILSRTPSTIPLPSTSNSTNTLLIPVDLSSPTSISTAFDLAIQKFSRIDVVINNAGYAHFAEFESLNPSGDDAISRDLFNINFWAPVQITRHALRIMREVNPLSGPKGGVIAQVSSAGGYVGVPGMSMYNASKFALEGFSEAVSKEVDPEWAVRFVVFEPGSVRTEWGNGNAKRDDERHEAYRGKMLGAEKVGAMRAKLEDKAGADAGNVADLMVGVVGGKIGNWDGREMLRLPITRSGFLVVRKEVEREGRVLDEWREVSESVMAGDVEALLRDAGMVKV